MMAAGQAALAGADVLLLEKMKVPGRKIIISGKGRCNITNQSDLRDFLSHFNKSGRFLHQSFSRFFVAQLMEFFEQEGLSLITERGGRVFPKSGKAQDVLHTLVSWLLKTGVSLKCSHTVTEIKICDNKVTGVVCNGKTLSCDAVILATGGSSYPATGSSGDGYMLAKALGHSIVPLRPALIPLEVKDTTVHKMAGLDLRNTGVRIYVNGKRKKTDFGEVGFTRFGIGGPVILTHSGFIVDCLNLKKKVSISLDLKPALDDQKLDARLKRDFQSRSKENLKSVLRGLMPQQMVDVSMQYLGLDGEKLAGEISTKERSRLRTWLKDYRFDITGYRPLRDAIVTAGGVQVKEVDPNTMESLKINGLYLTGELLDVDADTGGYNLQAAFSTGWLAGYSAAHKK